jgi:hypothetical protein
MIKAAIWRAVSARLGKLGDWCWNLADAAEHRAKASEKAKTARRRQP